MPVVLPQPPDIATTLTDLLGRPVNVKRAPSPLVAGPRTPVTVASYLNPEGKVQLLWVCELGLACSMGAALSLIPKGVAAESAKKGRVEESLRENLHEVMNVGASTLSGTGIRFVLGELITPPTPIPAEIQQLLARPSSRLDLEIGISGYDPGKMALLAH